MSYLVLARKYRPQTFEDVVEQAHVTRTLTNAIRSGRVAHAILFSGPRGTGKTTIARILAKAMNCEKGPTPVPCNACASCSEITNGGAVDVFEIDGASNNGVDHIRDLRDNVKYMPARSRYKIYIIDEVHMLSTPAFNALLKTLEEPPEHILFLFATTEPQKIPITILSRCQQHHLRRINAMDVARHMGALCLQEGLAVPEASLALIARETGGSMRDALSLLDQVMSCTEGEITHEGVLNLLGVASREVLFRITESVFGGNIADILDIIDDVYRRGRDIKAFFAALTAHFRDLWVVKTVKDTARIVDAPPAEVERMRSLVGNVSAVYLGQLLDAFLREESAVKFSSQPRLALEMAFIRLFQIRPALPIETVLAKLDDLARRTAAEPVRTRPAPTQMREPGP
ncbi:DNA polymerase III subunit gamma/tau, partial [Desulfococcus sp.]|uniref:DNA polymerase III subunit gamma/tau n=1 Tax=Desulfococcus sp. TaxID=2025834 RepID=UPI003593E631